jgi:hypothetical protein
MIQGLPDQLEALQGLRVNCDPLADDQHARVLTWGIDTLYVAIDIRWLARAVDGIASDENPPDLFAKLEATKEAARATGADEGEPIEVDGPAAWGPFLGNVAGYGIGGYPWVIRGRDMTWKLGSWLKPKSKPSLLVEFRSEALWRHGAKTLLVYVRRIIEQHGGRVEDVKVSRADFAADLLMREGTISRQTEGHIVSRVDATGTKSYRRRVNAVEVGFGGKLVCRIYDKPLEIKQKNDVKAWFYDVWGIESVPEDHAVFRVEFQLRREMLKELGVGDAEALMIGLDQVWAYCSKKWLRFVDRPDVKRDRQKLLGWWSVVQGAWAGSDRARPAERIKPNSADETMLARQILGCFTSLLALNDQQSTLAEIGDVDIGLELSRLAKVAERLGKTAGVAGDEVRRKLAKYRKGEGRFDAVVARRLVDRRRLMAARSTVPDRRLRVEDGESEVSKQFWRHRGGGTETPKPAAAGKEAPQTPQAPPGRPEQTQLALLKKLDAGYP